MKMHTSAVTGKRSQGSILVWSSSIQFSYHLPNSLRRHSTRVSFSANANPSEIICINDGDKNNNKKMFIFGMGFVGHYLADNLKQNGWNITGTCRSEESRKELEKNGYEAVLFDTEETQENLRLSSLEKALCDATHVISSIPPCPNTKGDPVISSIGPLLKQAVLKGRVSWIGYLSSTKMNFYRVKKDLCMLYEFLTGVYGHWEGAWVDEESQVRPVDESAIARLAAEKAWITWAENVNIPILLFRLGGIYGPGRSALNTIVKQKDLSGSQRMRGLRQYTSRVHVADICQAILASIKIPYFGRIYNVVDDDPAPREKVFAYARSLLGKNEAETDELRQNADKERLNAIDHIAEKRVSNKRLKEELKVHLLYPSYKSGLESILEKMD